MLISVVIPTFNVENYIEKCLNSVLNQTHKNIEIICIDDYSTDNTFSISKSYREKHSEIILLRNEKNKGAPFSRNRGLKIAKGEYIQFLDADDLLLPEKIKHQVELVSSAKEKPDFVAGNEFWEKTDGTRIEFHKFTRNPWKDLIAGTLGDTCSNLWKTESLWKINGWNESMKSSQEVDLLFRMMKINPVILYDDTPLTIIRQRWSGSISKTNRKENLFRQINSRIEIAEYMNEKGLMEEEIRNVFLRNIFNSIRCLYRFDRQTAKNFFDKHIPPHFPKSYRSSMTFPYRALYGILGFIRAEEIFSIFQKTER